MSDQSQLDSKYFVDSTVYNCPFCNRRNIRYTLVAHAEFDWSNSKVCHAYVVRCNGCKKGSLHLSYECLHYSFQGSNLNFSHSTELDEKMFYHHPTSFFVIDARIPGELRDLISEAEGCWKMNFLTGASACIRKAIYELVTRHDAKGDDYEERIKALSAKFPNVDKSLFEVLAHITGMTSDKVHEDSWPKWDASKIALLLETLRAILHEIYVVPEQRSDRVQRVRNLREALQKERAVAEGTAPADGES